MTDLDFTAEKIVQMPIGKVLNYARNARLHSPEQVVALSASMKEFGFVNPCLVDADGVLIAGHGRVLAAKELGLKTVPVIKVGHLTPIQVEALRLADNRLPEIGGGWDRDLLREHLRSLDGVFDLAKAGFDAIMLPQFLAQPAIGQTDSDDVPDTKTDPVVRLGDLWLLGEHRLIVGDSTDPKILARLMDGSTADLCFTDPPYRMEAEGGSAQPIGRAAAKLGESIKHLLDFDPPAFLEVLPSVFNRGSLNAYVFCNKDLVPDYLKWAKDKGHNFNILFWKKPMAIPLGGQHRPDVEYILFFRKKAIWNNAVDGAIYSKCLEFGREESEHHPTLKPVDLIKNEILISSRLGSVVVDFFGGAGSTMIACTATGRKCFSAEIDPTYAQVSIERWQKFSGKVALLGGRTLEQVTEERKTR